MRKTIVENINLIAFHPGQYIGELIEDYQLTQKEFAEKLELSPMTISKLVNGEESIRNNLAQKLEKLTNISMKTWLNLQASYDRKVAEVTQEF
ncbi:HigA family addiction module antitoxin [Streptococcus australis]